MKQDLLKLTQLQKVDLDIHNKEQQVAGLKENLLSMEKACHFLETDLTKQQNDFVELQALRRDHEASLKSSEETVNRSKSRLQSVKNTKEYMAIQKEMDFARKDLSKKEEELLQIMEQEKASQARISDHESKLAELKAQVEVSLAEGNARIAASAQSTASLREERLAIESDLPRSLVRKYESIRDKKDGLAVVAAAGGICHGCNMGIPPQLYNTLYRFNSIEQCPFCQRIIYWEGLTTQEPESDVADHAKANGSAADSAGVANNVVVA